jgi:hypothetical protein
MVGMFDDLVPQQSAGGMFDDLLPPKQRSWSDVPGEALRNAPSSAANLGKALVQPIIAPVETARGLGEVLAGGARNAAQAILPESAFNYLDSFSDPQRKQDYTAKADAVGQFYSDRYGSAEGLKNTLATDPVGAAADAAMVLYGGGALAPGRAGSAISKAGSVVDPIANTGRAIGKAADFAGRRTADVLGMTTGAGATPIRTAYDAGRKNNAAFVDQMRGNAPMDDVVSMAERGVGDMVKQRGDYYAAWMPVVKSDRTILDYAPVRKKLADATGMVEYKGVVKDAKAAEVLSNIQRLVDDFENIPGDQGKNIAGMDALKQAVGDIRLGTQPGTTARKVADTLYNEVKAQITKQAPQYADIMKNYSNASDTIGEMRRTLSINDKASTDTTMRKLQSVMRNNVNTNYGARQKLVDALAQSEPDLPFALAGQALNDYTPRGLARVTAGGTGFAATMNPSLLAALPAASPRLVGEAAFASGRFSKAIERAAQKAGMSPEKMARLLIALQATGNVSQEAEE